MLSGVLESLDRTEVTDLAARYGARVVTAVSGKTTHLLVGDEAGEAKSAKVRGMPFFFSFFS